MTTNPSSPTPAGETPRRRRKTPRTGGWRLRGLLLLAIGGAAYYGLEVGNQLLVDRLAGDTADEGVIQVIETPIEEPTAPVSPRVAASEGPGNALLRQAAALLDQGDSLSANISQVGWLGGQATQTQGVYHQLGGGKKRRFLTDLSGQVAGIPTRLLRVSDSRRLYTDLAWGEDPSNPERSVTRIDLRHVREAIEEQSTTPSPSDWQRFGGLPMLVTGLEEAFAFGQPRRMQFRNETVLAMVGRWRPERLEGLSAVGATADRAPQHVVIALSETTRFPLMVEYRDARDPLSANGLTDDAMLRPSRRPLLKIELARLPLREPLDPRQFTYQPNFNGLSDQTDRELRLVRARRDTAALASKATARR